MNTAAWPLLREDLALLPGPHLADGQPSWTLHDPARNQFFRIDWASFEMLSRWALGDREAIARDIAEHTTLTLSGDDIESLGQFLERNQLLQPPPGPSARAMAERWQAMRGNWVTWLLHHYLFFRIPLVRPDAWLSRWQPVARAFSSAAFLWMTLAAVLLGLLQVVRHWEHFTTSLVDTFNLEGLAAYGASLFVVKTLHELGHAFAAKRYGCRVPTMGVAFLVLWPVAYTDTNEAWKLTNHRHRMGVAMAGIATELVIAGWATLAWSLLPDGALRSATFVLATTSWIATLAVNASPFMRFDGYFILSDALDMPNLHERSFALARWQWREWLFDLQEPPPEHFSSGRHRALVAFACLTWIYRLALFAGIAIMVYHAFFKALGLLLFAVEVTWFIARPLQTEWRAWMARAARIRARPRTRRTVVIALVLPLLTLVPWPSSVTASALLRPVDLWPVHAPANAYLSRLDLVPGVHVASGQKLLELRSPELGSRIRAALARIEQLRQQDAAAAFGNDSRQQWLSLHESLITTEAELSSLLTEAERLQPAAPWNGRVIDLAPDLAADQWVGKNEPLAVLMKDGSDWLVETWLDEESVARIRVGALARFLRDSATGESVRLRVQAIDKDASRVLSRPELAAQGGGHVLVRASGSQLVPEQAIYRVQFSLDESAEVRDRLGAQGMSWRGRVSIDASSQALASRYLRQLFTVLVRETGF